MSTEPDTEDQSPEEPEAAQMAQAHELVRAHRQAREAAFLAELRVLCEKYGVEVSAKVTITALAV